jgi:hypothetical protein
MIDRRHCSAHSFIGVKQRKIQTTVVGGWFYLQIIEQVDIDP